MRNDLNASEKRLFAALDRIDAYLDRAVQGPAAAGDGTAMDVASEQRHAAALADLQARLDEAQRQLTAAGRQAVAMSAANDVLAKANRKLLDAAGSLSGDDARAALQAEIDALRAARGAEISQLGEIVEALDRMLDTPAPGSSRTMARAAKSDPDALTKDEQAAAGERG